MLQATRSGHIQIGRIPHFYTCTLLFPGGGGGDILNTFNAVTAILATCSMNSIIYFLNKRCFSGSLKKVI